MSLPFELVEDKKKSLYKSLFSGMRTLGGGIMRTGKNPYALAIGGGLYYGGDAMMTPEVENFVNDIPYYPQTNPVTGDFQFSTQDEKMDNENMYSDDDLEVNQFLQEYDPVGISFDNQDDRNNYYDNLLRERDKNAIEYVPPVEEIPDIDVNNINANQTNDVANLAATTGASGSSELQLMMQVLNLVNNKPPQPKMANMQPAKGLSLETTDDPYERIRRGIFG